MHFINNYNTRNQISFHLFRVIPKKFDSTINFCQSCVRIEDFCVCCVSICINKCPTKFEPRWRALNKIFKPSYACITLSIFINEKMRYYGGDLLYLNYYLRWIKFEKNFLGETFIIRHIMCLLFDSERWYQRPNTTL